jgi:small subunit ribosomal protein S5
VTSFRDRRPSARDESPGGFADSVIKIDRFAKVVKGGRRFSFGALVVVGDRSTHVGLGYGKANEVPQAVDKGIANAHKNILTINLKGSTIPHLVRGKHGASEVLLMPASEGTGVIAGKSLRPLLLLAGIRDVLTKSYGSTSPVNLLKAGVDALQQLRTMQTIQALRGVNVE